MANPKTAETPVIEAEAPKKRGWPAGKKRGPRIPRSEPIRDVGVMAKSKKIRTRKGNNSNKFFVDPNVIPKDMDYQWIATECLGQQMHHRRVQFEANAWEAVPADRHDGMFMPSGYKGEINVEGLVLMERPKELTDEAKAEDYARARQQITDKEKQIGVSPAGTMPRLAPVVNKTVERLAIPDK